MGDKNVFIMDKEYGWYPCQLVSEDGKKATVSVPKYPDQLSIICDGGKGAKGREEKKVNLKDYPGGVLPMQNVDSAGNPLEFPDMVELPYLHEAGILFNLKMRHMGGHPYTRTGDIIVAINPFQWFTHLYTEKQRSLYANKLVWEKHEGDPRKFVDPHVYETSALCFVGLAFGQMDQSILVSGESGAGKTETVKICMNHMASVQRGPVADTGEDSFSDPVVNRVLMSNPLLEAFGNAKTLRNDNSSRFGKYTQLQFDNKEAKLMAELDDRSKSYCTLAGSVCDVYLLEKNRITGHEGAERTYHVFYQLIAAGNAHSKNYWSELAGSTFDSFKYVGNTETLKIEGKTDDQHFETVVDTLKLIKVDGENLTLMMRAICAVMQLGNLTFSDLDGDTDKSKCTSPGENKKLSELMGVSEADLVLAFTERTMKTRNETYKVPLNPDSAKEASDSFAKEIYGKVFLWLVEQINKATCAEENYKDGEMRDYTFGVIGLLDIFGFESFQINRFEQLCINYANEKLQQKFTEDIFQSVQEEYESEGIALDEIAYDDNSDVLDLIEGRTGLCALLNEECVRPKGTPEGFVSKALQMNKKSECLFENKLDRRLSFGIHHYAGKVVYTCDNFVTRNQESLPIDLTECGQKSTNFIIANEAVEKKKADSGKAPKRQKSNLASPTVWTKYRAQLTNLMTDLRKTKSKYIRCIKPNMAKVPVKMDHLATVEQLRCAGVIAAITLSRSAFPNRIENEVCHYRFQCLWDKEKNPSTRTADDDEKEGMKKDIDAMITAALKPKEVDGKKVFVIGKTRTYFRVGALEYVEGLRAKSLGKYAARIQGLFRGRQVRKKYMSAKQKRLEEERKAREEAERAEREAKEAAERAEREKREAAERAEREAREKAEAEERKKREAAEKKEREKREKKERLERLKKEKEEKKKKEEEEKAAQAEIERLAKEAEKLQKELEKKKKEHENEIQRAEKEAQEEEERMKELQEKYEKQQAEANALPKKELEDLKKKAETSDKLVKYLKKENTRMRNETQQMEEDLIKMKETNNRLIEANASAGASLESLNKQAKVLEDHNKKLEVGIGKYKKENKKLEHDLKGRQAYVEAESQIRADYEQAMEKIVKMMEDRCSDSELVEKVMTAQLTCVTNIARGNKS